MIDQATPRKTNRRDFLKIAAAAGAAAAGGYLLLEFAPWLNYEREAETIRAPFDAAATGTRELHELIRYGTLAANGHNAQPWKFAVRDNGIDIFPDYSRRLPVVDPDDRELWISLGCALENVLVAARSAGYAAEVTYPETDDVIRIELSTDTPQASPLFDAIPFRQTNRSTYDGQTVDSSRLDALASVAAEPGVELHFVSTRTGMETVLEYVTLGNLTQYADKSFVDELIAWLRFNRREALASLDGLYTPASENPEVPRWLGQMFVAGTHPQQQADVDAAKLRSSPHALVIASAVEDRATWVRTGQVYERMALTMTSLGIHSAFLNQPIEVSPLRAQFGSVMNLGGALPQLLLRFGFGTAMPMSLRRPVQNVVV